MKTVTQTTDETAPTGIPWVSALPWIQLGVVAMFLFLGHQVMAYSDPHHWIYRAVQLMHGNPVNRRVLLFPLYLVGMLQLLGPYWVFLANIPWLILFVLQTGWLTGHLVSRTRPRIHSVLAIIMGMACLLLWTHPTLLRCVNPYREAGALALLTGGWLLFLRSESEAKRGWGFLSGILLTLSMGFRESMALSILPVAVWAFVRLVGRFRGRLGWSVSLLLGALLGLSPFLIQNHLYSGNALVPAYSAHMVLERAPDSEVLNKGEIETHLDDALPTRVRFRIDRLVPGMDPARFIKGAPKAWHKLQGRIGRIGLLFAALGLVAGIVSRPAIVLGLLLPSIVINYVFYSCYFYVKWRYFFIVDAQIMVLTAYGGFTLFSGAEYFIRKTRHRLVSCMCPAMLVLVVAGTGLWTTQYLLRQSPGLKAWEMASFRDEIAPRLEAPWTFVGHTHHREMLSWILGRDFRHSPIGSEMLRQSVDAHGFNRALHNEGTALLSTLRTENIYLYDRRQLPVLFPLCCELEPVADLGALFPRLYRYGSPMEKMLYRIRPWQQTNTLMNLVLPSPGVPTVLLMNVKHPWTYPERTTLSLWANGEAWLPSVEDGTQFHELPAALCADKRLSLELRSDAPTPSAPSIELWPQNAKVDLPFGFGAHWWLHDLVSSNLYNVAPLREDSFLLWNQGSIRFPIFADTNHEAHVELRMELYQEDALVRNEPAFLEAETVAGTQMAQFPGARQIGNVTFALGRGTGHLDWRTLDMTTTLHSYTEQQSLLQDESSGRKHWQFAKLYNARIFTVPDAVELPWTLNLGDQDSGAYLVKGLHLKDKHKHKHAVRWTDGSAAMRLPRFWADRSVCTLRFFPRPEVIGAVTPRLLWNGVDCAVKMIDRESHEWVEAVYAIPEGTHLSDVHGQVSILTPEWYSQEALGVPDPRKLGIMLYQIEVSEP
jgi:hypothetical protein